LFGMLLVMLGMTIHSLKQAQSKEVPGI